MTKLMIRPIYYKDPIQKKAFYIKICPKVDICQDLESTNRRTKIAGKDLSVNF